MHIRKNGSIIFTSIEDVNEYFEPRLNQVFNRIDKSPTIEDKILYGQLTGQRNSAKANFEENQQDGYYLTAIENAESYEELTDLFNTYSNSLYRRQETYVDRLKDCLIYAKENARKANKVFDPIKYEGESEE